MPAKSSLPNSDTNSMTRTFKTAASTNSAPSPSVASRGSRLTRGSAGTKTTTTRTSVKKMGSKIIGKMKGVRRRKDKKKGLPAEEGGEGDPYPPSVPETVSTPAAASSGNGGRKGPRGEGARGDDDGGGGGAPADAGADADGAARGLIHVILFLMNPQTRKFEILLLDFDAGRARVRDVLAQVAAAAKEESFRTQRFSGVADVGGCEMIDSHRLSRYASDWAVTVAIPDGMTSRECVELAGPILNDPRVKSLLEQHKMEKASAQAENVPDEAGSPSAATETTADSNAVVCAERSVAETKTTGGGGGGSSRRMVGSVLALLVLGVLFFVHKRTSGPLTPGDVLLPGEWRSNCGLLAILPKGAADFVGLRCSTARVGRDGVTSFHDGGNVAGQTGRLCTEGDLDCAPGAVVRGDGKVVIGRARAVLGKFRNVLTPEAFVQDPLGDETDGESASEQ